MGKIGNKRRNPVSDTEIVKMYETLRSANRTARELGIGSTTVYRVLERHSVHRDGLEEYRERAARFTSDKSAAIRAEYEDGASYADLVAKHGGTEYSIKTAIKRAGGSLVPVCPVRGPEEDAKIMEMHNAGMSQVKISLKLGRSQSVVSRSLREQGFIHKPMAGEMHRGWRGGRWVDGHGYVKVMVSSDDPLVSMREKSGYASEHRLVMARSLGRPLTKFETVHHINGNTADNRPENLQLRKGRHGKGVVLRCLDCGSENIGPGPLKEAHA